jgi:GT2 family glycosyltransferase
MTNTEMRGMKTERPLVSVVLLSHDRPAYLPKALDSLIAQTYPHLEIVVVDNHSRSSEEIARAVEKYEGVRLIRNAENLGFTGGMNRGIEAARGVYVYCTNDDVVVDRECVERLVEYAEAHPEAGLLTGVQYREDRRTILCAGGEFHLEPIYVRKFHGHEEADTGQFREPFKVTCIDGAMTFGPRALLQELKGFREDFFIYVDSIELSARVLKRGREIVCVPSARAYVFDAPHVFTNEGIAFHKVKNLFAFYLLHARARVLPEFFLRYGVLQTLRALGGNRKVFLQMLRAWAWLVANSPALLRERRLWTKS